jgi:hypothetical protein
MVAINASFSWWIMPHSLSKDHNVLVLNIAKNKAHVNFTVCFGVGEAALPYVHQRMGLTRCPGIHAGYSRDYPVFVPRGHVVPPVVIDDLGARMCPKCLGSAGEPLFGERCGDGLCLFEERWGCR